MNKDWIYTTNIYEVNVRQFTEKGTFKAFAQHLPRLRSMGVETLWFMPVTPISEKEKKGTMGSYYACSDYTSINPEFGTMQDFKNLVKQAHKLGFMVIIDWVANHTGWDHVWTMEHPDWYEKDKNGNFKKASGMDDIIELDYTNADMRRAMIEAMKFWVRKCGIDGFRCDLASWVELDFWMEAIPELNELKPLLWLGEMDAIENPEYMQVFDAAYGWMWMHRTEDFCKKQLSLAELVTILYRYESIPGITAWFTSNHDENSWNGTEYEKYGGAAKALAVHSCTWPGIPLVYNGQELPNEKRLKFFDKDMIEWKKRLDLEEFYTTLLTLHHTHPALHVKADVYRLNTSRDANVFAYFRKKDHREVIVILNLSDHIVRFDLLNIWVRGVFTEIFSGTARDFSSMKSFEMKGWEYLVYER
ncbi:MAG: alpha-amylase family glycosyl hydrolase [Flavisolibacter sp.]